MGSFTGNNLIDELSRRLRDTNNLGYPRATVLDILNRSQRSINARLSLVHATATLTTTNSPLYSIPAIATDIVRVSAIRHDGRELTKIPWEQLAAQGRGWPRQFGPKPEEFGHIGRDLLFVVPLVAVPVDLTVVYVRQTPDMDDGVVTPLAVPDEHASLVLDLSEAVLLYRGREFRAMQQALSRVAPALGIEDLMQGERRGGRSDA